MRKLSKNFFSFPKKRIFFLWILSLWAPSIFSFDSHEHVYLGECLELKYEGDDPTYKEASLYKEAYEKIATHNKLSGTLCDKVKGNDVYRIKLNQFNFKGHETLTDIKIFKDYRKNSNWNDINYSNDTKETTWSIGEIISIAGDYIGLTIQDGTHKTKAPAISDPLFEELKPNETLTEDQLKERLERVAQNVLKAFNYMKTWKGNLFFETNIENKKIDTWFRNLIKNELNEISTTYSNIQKRITFDSSSHRAKYTTGKRFFNQIITSVATSLPYQNIALLSANVDHFAPDAQYVYQVGHNLACSFAMSAKKSFKEEKKSDLANKILSEAYGIEAFVSHYLSDLFSAGHVRTPRRAAKELRKLGKENNSEIWKETTMDLAGNLVHDVDGWLGLKVCNGPSCNNEWTVYGDNSLFDKKSEQNRKEAIKTLQDGFNEIRDCYDSI